MPKNEENMDAEFQAKRKEIEDTLLEWSEKFAALKLGVKSVLQKVKTLGLKAVDVSDLKRIEKWLKEVIKAFKHYEDCENMFDKEAWEMLKHMDGDNVPEMLVLKESIKDVKILWKKRPVELKSARKGNKGTEGGHKKP